ncbi:MAG TPA: GTPase domain-containing protein [Gemmataceae bacterium]|nr:GTPase domain-containing protein [Gemmataceae bacterium]
MEHAGVRSLTNQLAEDFAWLEEHARAQAKHVPLAAELHYAAALVRNVLAPYLEGHGPQPLHVAVVGGAGAGKSTVANMLCGAVLAESNPQAGFTRHPVAYVPTGQVNWPSSLGYLGRLQRLDKVEPSSLDADVYQIRRVSPEAGQFGVLEKFLVWDCPDMTTWAALGYVPRLLEVAALADVIVYVASDERYNDEVPTQFLKLLLRSGKLVVVCLMKMRETDAPAFVEHFQRAVLDQSLSRPVAIMTVPHLTHAQLVDPNRNAPKFRVPIVNQIFVLGDSATAARQRNVQAAMQYLASHQQHLLSVARDDLIALEGWQQLVREGQLEFDNRYRREFLTTERFRRFDEALVRLLELLELPGIGRFVSKTMDVLRFPWTMTKKLFNTALARPDVSSMPEKQVLEDALAGWTDQLRKEAARKAATHPLWRHVNDGFNTGLADTIKSRFNESLKGFEISLNEEVDRTARAIYEDLEKKPVALNAFRGTKFGLEIAGIVASATAIFHGGVVCALLIPLSASVVQMLVEFFGKQYVDFHREQTRDRQQALVNAHVSAPLADWLTKWPTTGGSAHERLQRILHRLPENVLKLHEAIAEVGK